MPHCWVPEELRKGIQSSRQGDGAPLEKARQPGIHKSLKYRLHATLGSASEVLSSHWEWNNLPRSQDLSISLFLYGLAFQFPVFDIISLLCMKTSWIVTN